LVPKELLKVLDRIFNARFYIKNVKKNRKTLKKRKKRDKNFKKTSKNRFLHLCSEPNGGGSNRFQIFLRTIALLSIYKRL